MDGGFSLLQVTVLGLVQGVLEFLPISSSAHLILVPKLTGWPDQGLLFDISVHFGTLAAVMLYFRKEVARLLYGKADVLRGRFHTENARLFGLLVVSTLPLVFLGYVLKDYVEHFGRSVLVIGVASLVYGSLLWYADTKGAGVWHNDRDGKRVGKPLTTFEALNRKRALAFGLMQVLAAAVPGTSRSGITMTAGRLLGFDRPTAARWSMLMSIPVIVLMALASLVSDFHVGMVDVHRDLPLIGFGMLVACVSALLAIHTLLKLVQRMSFFPFVVYRLCLGVFLLWWYFMGYGV